MTNRVSFTSRRVLYANDSCSSLPHRGNERILVKLLWSKISVFRLLNFSRAATELCIGREKRLESYRCSKNGSLLDAVEGKVDLSDAFSVSIGDLFALRQISVLFFAKNKFVY